MDRRTRRGLLDALRVHDVAEVEIEHEGPFTRALPSDVHLGIGPEHRPGDRRGAPAFCGERDRDQIVIDRPDPEMGRLCEVEIDFGDAVRNKFSPLVAWPDLFFWQGEEGDQRESFERGPPIIGLDSEFREIDRPNRGLALTEV